MLKLSTQPHWQTLWQLTAWDDFFPAPSYLGRCLSAPSHPSCCWARPPSRPPQTVTQRLRLRMWTTPRASEYPTKKMRLGALKHEQEYCYLSSLTRAKKDVSNSSGKSTTSSSMKLAGVKLRLWARLRVLSRNERPWEISEPAQIEPTCKSVLLFIVQY